TSGKWRGGGRANGAYLPPAPCDPVADRRRWPDRARAGGAAPVEGSHGRRQDGSCRCPIHPRTSAQGGQRRRDLRRNRHRLRIAVDVLGALELAHDQGVFHRDVKPANIIVTDDGRDGDARAVLIDFGLARSAWLDATLRDQPVGTARYLAPEAAGLIESGVD